MPSSHAAQHPGCCLCGASQSSRHLVFLLVHFCPSSCMALLDNGSGKQDKLLWIKGSHCIVCVRICVCALAQPHHVRQSSGTKTIRLEPNSTGRRRLLKPAYTVRGVGKRLFNQGHLAHLLFSPQPAFHPAPGELGDRWGTIHSLQGFTHNWPHTQTHAHTFEGGGGWCMAVKMQRDRQGFWLSSPLLHILIFGSVPLIMCQCVCFYMCVCPRAHMSTHVSMHLY